MSTVSFSESSERGKSPSRATNRWPFFWLMLAASVAPMLVPYFTNLWSREPYRFFPFALLAVGFLAHLRWDRQCHPPRGVICWVVIVLGITLTATGILVASPWLCAIAFVAFAGTFFYSSTDSSGQSLFGLTLPLLMIINLPLGYDQLLTIRLQQVTTGLSSVLLDFLAIPHAVSNNTLQLATRELFVAEACSGIQSVFTLMFLATLLLAFYRRPVWLAPIYFLIAVILAVAANVLRVTAVAIGDVWLSVDLAEGWQHEIIGYTALIAGTLLLLSFDHLVTLLLHPVDPVVEGENNVLITAWNYMVGAGRREPQSYAWSSTSAHHAGTRVDVKLWQSLWSRRVMIGTLSLIGAGALAQAVNLNRPVPAFIKPTEIIYQPAANVFEQQLKAVEVVDHDQARGGSNPRLGENADIWTCAPRQVNAEIQFVLSQPYTNWHELCICYEINAWVMLNREIRGSRSDENLEDGSGSFPYALARFKNSDGRFAYLIYSAIDEGGNFVEPPPHPGRLENRFMAFLGDSQQSVTSNVMMIQMFIVAQEKLETDALRELSNDFVTMRSLLSEGVKKVAAKDQTSVATKPIADAPATEGEG